MERRKILLGSGAALATVLAGCSSSETGEENPEDDDQESFGDEDDENTSDEQESSDDENDEHDDVPGFKNDDLEVSNDKLTVTTVRRDGAELHVIAETTTTDSDELEKVFESLADDLAAALTDTDRFKDEIDTIEWVLEHEGSRVLAIAIDAQWVVDYLEGEMSKSEFTDKVKDSKKA